MIVWKHSGSESRRIPLHVLAFPFDSLSCCWWREVQEEGKREDFTTTFLIMCSPLWHENLLGLSNILWLKASKATKASNQSLKSCHSPLSDALKGKLIKSHFSQSTLSGGTLINSQSSLCKRWSSQHASADSPDPLSEASPRPTHQQFWFMARRALLNYIRNSLDSFSART